MMIFHLAIIALADAARSSSANAAHCHRGASNEQLEFVARSDAMDSAAERSALGRYAADEDSSISVSWREIGGF